MMLMFLEGETQGRLAILAKDRTATFRARGYAATNSKGQLFFEPSRCVFLHRLAAVQSKPVVQDAKQRMEQARQKAVSRACTRRSAVARTDRRGRALTY